MDKKEPARKVPPIGCFIATGSKPVELCAESGRMAIPGERLPGAEPLRYGQYLGSVARLLRENSYRLLRRLLKSQPEPAPPLESASAIELISEKHGALYSVSRLRVSFPGHVRSFAVNCAFSPEQQAFLTVETKLLSKLNSKFRLPYLPRSILCVKQSMEGHPDGSGLMLSFAGWFEDHHEFHLSQVATGGAPAIMVWDNARTKRLLSAAEAEQIYAEASGILTLYLDTRSFSQIHPWHHGAGDFIVNRGQSTPSLRLITVRGYRSLLAPQSDCSDKMLGALHFFMNMGIRMRIDRLDGTGDLAWAGSQSLAGVIRGFTWAWGAKSSEESNLPKAHEIFSLFLSLSTDERLAFTQAVARDGQVEAGEGDFLFSHLPRHVVELSNALVQF